MMVSGGAWHYHPLTIPLCLMRPEGVLSLLLTGDVFRYENGSSRLLGTRAGEGDMLAMRYSWATLWNR
jgi:hypothetical protein